MKLYERELFLYKLLKHGYEYVLPNGNLIYYRLDNNSKIKAQQEFINSLNHISFEGLYDDNEVFRILTLTKLWTQEEEKLILKTLPDQIESLKVDIFKNYFSEERRKTLKYQLGVVESQFRKLLERRHQFDWITIMGVATYYKIVFLVENCTKYASGEVYDWRDIDITTFLSFLNKEYLTDTQIREIARNEPWQSIWRTSTKDCQIFGISSVDLTDDQKKLLLWSNFYDNIHESAECPADEIIDDDDALDGWLITQRKNKDKRNTENLINEKLTNSKIANSDEIYIVAENEEQATKIDDMNNPTAKMVKKQRLAVALEKGSVEEQNLPDVKLKLGRMANEAFIKHAKGK